MTDSLILFVDDFGTSLLCYRIEFSCLYIPQGENFKSTMCRMSTFNILVSLILLKIMITKHYLIGHFREYMNAVTRAEHAVFSVKI